MSATITGGLCHHGHHAFCTALRCECTCHVIAPPLQVAPAPRRSRSDAIDQSPSYRAAMRDAGRGRLLR